MVVRATDIISTCATISCFNSIIVLLASCISKRWRDDMVGRKHLVSCSHAEVRYISNLLSTHTYIFIFYIYTIYSGFTLLFCATFFSLNTYTHIALSTNYKIKIKN